MSPRGSKIDDHGIIQTVFDPKITFPTCARVKNISFDQFLFLPPNMFGVTRWDTFFCSQLSSW